MTLLQERQSRKTQQTTRSLVLRNAGVVTMDGVVARPLGIRDGRVCEEALQTGHTIDLRDHLVFPGLVNAHDHLHLNLFPKLRHSGFFKNSYDWIEAFQSHLDDPEIAAVRAISSRLRHWHGGLKNLLSGVTTVAHHDPWQPVFDEPGFPARVLRSFGWSHSLGLSEDAGSGIPNYGSPVAESYSETPRNVPWIIHAAEGTDSRTGSELDRLDALRCLNSNTVLVHGVALTEKDINRIIERRCRVVWCPSSNLALLGCTLNPRRLFDAGLLALGTDARISAAQDILEELRIAAAHSDLAPNELFRLVTQGSATTLVMPEVGGLAQGQMADCVIVRDSASSPSGGLLQLKRSDIRAVVRGGMPVIADPDFVDWFEICGCSTVEMLLDGRPKLCDAEMLGPSRSDTLEPGFIRLENGGH